MNPSSVWYAVTMLLISLSSAGSVDVDTLKRAADRDFIFLLIASGLVALGVLCEAGDVFKELKRWWKTRGRKRSVIPLVSAVGLMLVTIGVIGEGIYEGKLGIVDTKIRQIDEKSARDAGDAAKRAQDSADAAKTDEQVRGSRSGNRRSSRSWMENWPSDADTKRHASADTWHGSLAYSFQRHYAVPPSPFV